MHQREENEEKFSENFSLLIVKEKSIKIEALEFHEVVAKTSRFEHIA